MTSTSCACQLLGGKLVCWSAKKQQSVAMYLAKAEYVAATGCCANILWMKSQLTNYDIIYEKVPIFCNNTSAIAISNNPVLHLRRNHIDIRYHFIKDHIINGDIELHFIPTQYQLADILTKPLDELTFKRLNVDLGGKTGGLDKISNKDATILYCLANGVFSVHNWTLKSNQPEEAPFTDHMKAICKLDMYVDSKALKPSSQTEEVPQGKKPRAKSKLKRKPSKHTFKCNTEASKSKTGQLKKETQSSSANDKSPSHLSPPTLVVGEMHKEAQQAASGLTSLGATSKEGARSQLSSDSIAEADGTSAPNDSIHSQQGTNKDSRANEISKKIKLEDLSDLLKDTRSAFLTPNSLQDEPIIVSDKSEEEETEKDKEYLLPLIIYLKTLQFTIVVENASGATTKDVPSVGQATTSPAKGEKITNPAIKDAEPNMHDELVDLLGIDVVTRYYNKKLLYDKYCDKMIKRRKSSKITNCDVLTQKGPISLKVYREDETTEVISNFKLSDLHLTEWREVVQACPDRKEKGWKTIYELIKIRMEYLDETKKELKIDFNIPLKEQDPLKELNDLANKKRKRTGGSTDHSRLTKKHRSLVRQEEEVH
nr:retrovirus-related Pol polyprotein from transposon TNT 1-94 [Tanacetum cinerariifolium]